jgi:Protein of unknown function (DUF1559)
VPIILNCDCGKKLQVGDDMAGRRAKCPACGTILAIAAPVAAAPVAIAPATIRCVCQCGKTLQVRAEHAGRNVRCPACQSVLTVPGIVAAVPTAPRARRPAPPPTLPAEELFPLDQPVKRKARSPARRPLWPWIAAAVCLVLLTTGGLLAWVLSGRGIPGISGAGGVSAPEFPADLALVPANAQGFAAIRVGDLTDLPDYKMARQFLPPIEAAKLADVESKLGVSIADVERITFVSTDGEKMEMWGVIALKKPYDSKKIKDLFPPGTQEIKHGNATYHLLAVDDPKVAIHFVNDRILVAGTESGVKRCLKQMDEKTSAGPLAEGLKLAAANHHIVVAGAPPVDVMQKLKKTMPPGMEAFAGFLDLQTGTLVIDETAQALQLDLRLNFPTEAKAQEVKSAMDGLVGMGRLFLPQLKAQLTQGPNAQEGQKVAAWLEATLNSVKPEQKGSSVTLNLKLDTSGVSESLQKMFQVAGGNVQQAALKTQNANNLKQLALAMQNYADVHQGQLPPAVITSKLGKRPLYSWRVALLPYLEEGRLYEEFHRTEAWNSPHNSKLLARMPNVFRLPGQPPGSTVTHYQVFTGPGTPFVGNQGPRMPGGFPDGTSNTILIAEAAQGVPWTMPEDLHFTPNQPLQPLLGGHFGNVFDVAMADGAVVAVPRTISDTTLRNAINPSDGMVLGKDWPGR